MDWTAGAASIIIIALRCQNPSGRWDALWSAGPPAARPPSDRQQDSDTQATAAIKIIPNKAVVHPVLADAARPVSGTW